MNRLVLIVFSVVSCTLLPGCPSTGACDDITKGAQLADLLLSAFETVFNDSDESNPFYQVTHTIINSASDIVCPEEVAGAEAHTDAVPLIFSETEDFSNPEVVAQKEMTIANSVGPDQTYNIESEIVFDVDGFYAIDSDLDINGEVQERNEQNNNSFDPIVSSSGRVKRQFPKNVIKVQNTGNQMPSLDENGNPIYVRRWDVQVVY